MRIFIATLLLQMVAMNAIAQFDPQRYPVIPHPQTLLALSDNFNFGGFVTIVTEGKGPRKECEVFRQQVKQLFGIELNYAKFAGFTPYIYVQLDSSFVPAEGYRLIVTKQGIDVYGTRAGVFYGLQTLLQLIQRTNNNDSRYFVPACSIIDYPRFSWRGTHLDVARHFFPKENVKDYLRWMAYYKLNTFHWHLTDDQGWRIQIKQYPLLTDVGAWRNATLIGHYSEEPDRYDSTRYGGFYTQEEIKEVVRFADSLHITIVPEIEMPGHARALLAAYPDMGSGAKQDVACTWGVFNEVMWPKEETFIIMQRILDEVCELFPGKYIHIGGDECPKDEWNNSEICLDIMRRNELKDAHELQSFFIQRIVTYLGTKNKKAIGWDEILEGGLAEGAAVMSWRGEDGGIAAAKAGHNVVMTPGSHCYFDKYQSQMPGEPLAIGGYLPLEKVYSYDPVPASLNEAEKKYIMGVQANVWTEYISSYSQVQYMIFPRIAALAEVAWARKEIKDYDKFLPRAIRHMDLYGSMHVNYSRAVYDISATYAPAADGSGVLISLTTIAPYGQIRYNRGGLVTLGDSVYRDPVLIKSSTEIRASIFYGEERLGKDYNQLFRFNKAMGKKVVLRKEPAPAYNTGGAFSLVDGITGRRPWTGSEWLGWWGDTLDATIDLGKVDSIRRVGAFCLHDEGSWIWAPSLMEVYTSVDGVHYERMSGMPMNLSANGEPTADLISRERFAARYVHVVVYSRGTIVPGKPGAGYPAWLFVSEIIVE